MTPVFVFTFYNTNLSIVIVKIRKIEATILMLSELFKSQNSENYVTLDEIGRMADNEEIGVHSNQAYVQIMNLSKSPGRESDVMFLSKKLHEHELENDETGIHNDYLFITPSKVSVLFRGFDQNLPRFTFSKRVMETV